MSESAIWFPIAEMLMVKKLGVHKSLKIGCRNVDYWNFCCQNTTWPNVSWLNVGSSTDFFLLAFIYMFSDHQDTNWVITGTNDLRSRSLQSFTMTTLSIFLKCWSWPMLTCVTKNARIPTYFCLTFALLQRKIRTRIIRVKGMLDDPHDGPSFLTQEHINCYPTTMASMVLKY